MPSLRDPPHRRGRGGAAVRGLSALAAVVGLLTSIPARAQVPLDDAPAVPPAPLPLAPRDGSAPAMVPPCTRFDQRISDAERTRMAAEQVSIAQTRFEAGDASGALVAIDLAECYDEHADYDFMRAIIFESIGDCTRSQQYARRFLASQPAELDAKAARAMVHRCTTAEERADVVPLPSLEGPVPLDDAPPAPAPSPAARPWWKDPWAGALASVGGATLVTGVGLLIGARVVERRDADSYQMFNANQRRSTGLQIGGGVMLGIASASLVSAAVRWIVLARRGQPRQLAHR